MFSICQTGRPDRPVCKSNVSLEGMVLQNFENHHSENGKRYFEEIRRTSIKLILQIGTFRLRTDWSVRPALTNGKRLKM